MTVRSSGHRWAGEVHLLPLDEMVARIELARAEAGPLFCDRCGSTTPARSAMKTCFRCGVTRPVALFARHRRRADGLQPLCRPCNRARLKQRRTAEALAALRRAS